MRRPASRKKKTATPTTMPMISGTFKRGPTGADIEAISVNVEPGVEELVVVLTVLKPSSRLSGSGAASGVVEGPVLEAM